MSVLPPSHAQILVVGGGPSGSYAAAALAREGFDVVLLEAATFPSPHIMQPGAAMKFNQHKREAYTDFVALGQENASWNVVRSEFDELLLNHAAESGARVFQSTKVTSVHFSPDSNSSLGSSPSPGRPISATWVYTPPSSPDLSSSISTPTEDLSTGTITFDYLIDASGRAGILSTKYHKDRRFNASLKNVAMWGYWSNAGTYGKGTGGEGAPFFQALTDESGWAWFIPLHNGTTSVGIVMDKNALGKRKCSQSSATATPSPSSPSSPPFSSFLWGRASPGSSTDVTTPPSSPFTPHLGSGGGLQSPRVESGGKLVAQYLAALELAPAVKKLIGEHGTMLQSGLPVNDADDDDKMPEKDTETVHTASDYSYSASTYAGAGFRIVGDAGDNFDKAFSFLRPVIQGSADLGPRLSESEVQSALDFCTDLFNPVTQAEYDSVRARMEGLSIREEDVKAVDGAAFSVLPPVTGRKRSGTIDTVMNWLGKVRGGEDSDSPSTNPIPLAVEPPPIIRVDAEEQGKATTPIIQEDTGKGKAVRVPTPDLFDVTTPALAPAQLAAFLQRAQAHPRLVIDTTNISASPSPSSSILPSVGLSPSSSLLPSPHIRDTDADEETRRVLSKINARRVIHHDHNSGVHSLEEETLGGLAARLVRGRLGLARVEEKSNMKEG
ncbi:hypothetical protein EWM64_g2604 [Hericium alpestre]|uniref:FAD-binding domain-containing protein n=1 Tax=Hericium alpestre TaxID=135208 RepID=A0A4Z0A683_9AGAM|nr:hypothetical protein EWM64_g2604 [Hericium alpestre]